MKNLIQNLCGKLKDWGIDPIILVKAISIFIILTIILISMITFPNLFISLLIIALCIAMIGLIYSLIESYERSNN